jgi:two-component sensor histidine kinase
MTGPDDRGDSPKPVVESSPVPVDPTTRALHLRIRQQEILAELGVRALQGASFDELLNQTVRLTAEGMEAEFCKVLEYIREDKRFLVRAGVGWAEGIVGTATVGADLESPSGFALRTGRPVVSNHLENEQRFRTPELLVQHGVRRAMNVILQGDGAPYGVLEVDSRSEGEFSEHDISFLQGAANILGMAIERQRYERQLKATLGRHQVLLKEINHRVKNSLQVVTGMLNLQASVANDEKVSAHLAEASNRISTIARSYERLAYGEDVENISLGIYLQEVCADAVGTTSQCKVEFDGDPGIRLDSERAIPIALIANELVTNAVKYAFPDRSDGQLWVRLAYGDAKTILFSVRDNGIGFPREFDPTKSRGMGMRIVTALAKQLDGRITQYSDADGTEFTLLVPLDRRSES